MFYIIALVAQMVTRLPAVLETWVQSLGQEGLLEKEMATHSSTLAWKIPWMEEPGGLQSMGSQRVRHDWVTSLSLSYNSTHVLFWYCKLHYFKFSDVKNKIQLSKFKDLNWLYSNFPKSISILARNRNSAPTGCAKLKVITGRWKWKSLSHV